MTRTLRAGVLAGAAGTCAEAMWAVALHRLRRRTPVYDSARMARRLARHRLGVEIDHRTARVAGSLLRAAYGPSLGVLVAILTRGRRSVLANSLATAAAIWLGELVALPRSGATPPLCTWPRGEALLDVTNALAFSVVTCATLSCGRRA